MTETTRTADELLAHAEWLHRIARSLVGDAVAADIVQDTFEIALKARPKAEGPLRPWLGGVVRNVARMATRGRVRREKREQRAAVDSSLGAPVPAVTLASSAGVAMPQAGAFVASQMPSPEELVARAELHQRVGRMVLELPEPLRATVLLRFFEDMSAADIARAQGIPAATVRSRLKDALDRIRTLLDREHAGDRRAWAVLLAPISTATPSGVALVAGGLIVKTGMKIVIALVVAATLLVGTRFAGLWGGTKKPVATAVKPVAPPPVAVTPAKPAVPANPSTASSTRAMPAVHDDDPKGTLRLEGQVVDEKDAPVAGATVAIDANPPITVQSDTSGSFTFEGLIARDYRQAHASKA